MRLLSCAAAGVFVLFAGSAEVTASEAQPEIRLPAVTGPHGVGRSVWHWIDDTRADTSVASPGHSREIVSALWYPADTANALPTGYRPLSRGRFEHVHQNAVAAAPFAVLEKPAPLIVLCPGRGTSLFYYATVAEDLASLGYAVLAVDSPSLGYVEFPDGRIVDSSDAYKPSFELITGPYEKVDKFYEPAVEIGLADYRFALARIASLNDSDPARRLTKRLDLSRIGAFGHSLGGRICGALADADPRVVALAAMEGVPPRNVRRNGIDAATLMLYSSELPEEMALPNIREVYDHRRTDSAIVRLEGFGHNSVTDRPLLFPGGFEYAVDPARALVVTRRLLAAFFDAYVSGGKFGLDALAAMDEVTVIAGQ